VSIDVVQLLNIAMALRVPLIYLLAPIARVDETLYLPGLSQELAVMTVGEFDAWLSGLSGGVRKASSLDERNATAELEALRLWMQLTSEVVRLTAVLELERDASLDTPTTSPTHSRLEDARRAADRQFDFLSAADWPMG